MNLISPAELQALVTQGVYLHTHQEMLDKIQREERECFCFRDQRYCEKFSDDPSVSWEAFLFRRHVRDGLGHFGVYVRAERACGMVQFWGEDWIPSPQSGRFWPYLFRRAEKQCASLWWAPGSEHAQQFEKIEKQQKDRQRGSSSWRRR